MALNLGSQRNVPSGEGNRLGGSVVPAQGIHEESSTKKHPLGTRLQLGERVFYYSQASEALSPGKLATALPTVFTETTVTVAHPVGTKKVTITASANIAAGQLEDGYLVVDEGTGAGEVYKIKSNPAITSAATGEIELYDGLVTAWSTSDTDLRIYTSPFRVQESNTGQDEAPAGVPHVSVTDEYYFWLQTYGPAPVLMDETTGDTAATRTLTIGSGTAGAVEAIDAIGEAYVGDVILEDGDETDARYALVDLKIRF